MNSQTPHLLTCRQRGSNQRWLTEEINRCQLLGSKPTEIRAHRADKGFLRGSGQSTNHLLQFVSVMKLMDAMFSNLQYIPLIQTYHIATPHCQDV